MALYSIYKNKDDKYAVKKSAIDKVKGIVRAIQDNPDVQNLVMSIVRPKTNLLSDTAGVVEQEAFGAGRQAAARPADIVNFLAKVGSKVSGLKNAPLNRNTLPDLLMPESSMSTYGKNAQAKYGKYGQDIGKEMYNTGEAMAVSSATLKGLAGAAKGGSTASSVINKAGYAKYNPVKGMGADAKVYYEMASGGGNYDSVTRKTLMEVLEKKYAGIPEFMKTVANISRGTSEGAVAAKDMLNTRVSPGGVGGTENVVKNVADWVQKENVSAPYRRMLTKAGPMAGAIHLVVKDKNGKFVIKPKRKNE